VYLRVVFPLVSVMCIANPVFFYFVWGSFGVFVTVPVYNQVDVTPPSNTAPDVQKKRLLPTVQANKLTKKQKREACRARQMFTEMNDGRMRRIVTLPFHFVNQFFFFFELLCSKVTALRNARTGCGD